MRTLGSCAFALLLGFLLGAAAHRTSHKYPAVIRFEPASQKIRPHLPSKFIYSGWLA